MNALRAALDIFLHIDVYLGDLIKAYGGLTYLILFLIVFCETGLVVMPFLPGDSMLFVAGTFAALGAFNVHLLVALLIIAAILGDTLNYWIGHHLGKKAFEKDYRWLNKEYLNKAEAFYEKHGGRTIVLARFIPIIRTFAPFVAGAGSMDYRKFAFTNAVGGILWVGLFVYSGYFFGNLAFVRKYFEWLIVTIVVVSFVPVVWEVVKHRWPRKSP